MENFEHPIRLRESWHFPLAQTTESAILYSLNLSYKPQRETCLNWREVVALWKPWGGRSSLYGEPTCQVVL